MDNRNYPVSDTTALGTLGISGFEKRAYLVLLKSRKATAPEVARQMRITQRRARRLLAQLEAKGLATHTPKIPKVYIAAPPEFAIDALIKQRQMVLEQARTAIPVLTEAFTQPASEQASRPMLELITNRSYLGLVLTRMYESFTREIMSFQRAPILVPSARTSGTPPRGACIRSISDQTFLDAPGALAALRDDISRGEQARTFSRLPFKMMIADRTLAVITLGSHNPEHAPTLLIHRSALLEALCLLFECVWEKATPIPAPRGVNVHGDGVGASLKEPADGLIALLSAGLNDKAIAQELSLSARTLNRHVADLMATFGTRTRFQLGLHIGAASTAEDRASPTTQRRGTAAAQDARVA